MTPSQIPPPIDYGPSALLLAAAATATMIGAVFASWALLRAATWLAGRWSSWRRARVRRRVQAAIIAKWPHKPLGPGKYWGKSGRS